MERQTVAKVQKSPLRGNHMTRQSAGPASPVHPLLELQRLVGSHATHHLITSPYLQTKLQISTPDDPFEREADRVADTVMRMPDPGVAEEPNAEAPQEIGATITRLQRAPLPSSTEQEEDLASDEESVQRAPVAVHEEDEEEKISPELAEEPETVPELHREIGSRVEEQTGEAIATQQPAGVDQEIEEQISPKVDHHVIDSDIQLKCEDGCAEEDGEEKTLQREPVEVSNDEEEEKVAPVIDTAPPPGPELSPANEATRAGDLPIRRQTRDEDEIAPEPAPTGPESIEEHEQVQAKSIFSGGDTSPTVSSSRWFRSPAQRLCKDCEEEQEQETGQPVDSVQRETDSHAPLNSLEASPVNEAPIRRQTKSEDEKFEFSEVESNPIQRQMEEEEEKEDKLQRHIIHRSFWQRSPNLNHAFQPQLQRRCTECQSEGDHNVDTQLISREPAGVPSPRPRVNASVATAVHSLDGAGRPLSNESRMFFEPRFGVNFGHVRIHTDARAVETARSINARAFTFGPNIAFGAGEYSPDTETGKHVLAHELTHVVQQTGEDRSVDRLPEVDHIARLTADEQVQRGIDVYDLLDGWTSSQDSADILQKFSGLPKTDVNQIINAAALHASMSVFDIYKWLHSDMVTSDWKLLLRMFTMVGATGVTELIGYVVVKDYLDGWTSEEDSKEALEYLKGVGGTQLDEVIAAMETHAGQKPPEMILFLFNDLGAIDALNLSLHFMASGSLKAMDYAIYWYADKVRDLLSGYTSINDSESIVKNFQRVGGEKGDDKISQVAVLTKLDELCRQEFSQSAEDALMEDMQQEDYIALHKMLPQNLRPYDLEKNFLSQAWDKIVNGYDYVAGFIEYVVCGIAGIVVGIFDAIVSIVSGVIDIGFAIKNIIGWLISKASGGHFARESEENVNQFFTSLGQALGAPLDLIGNMWDETVKEASLIEGPFQECQLAIFWVRKVTNIVVNIILLLVAGYGAAKAALEALETIKNISTFAAFLSKIGKLPAALLRKLKTVPANLAGVVRVVINTILNVDKIIASTRKTIGVIRLAARDQNFWLNLRRASGDFIEGKLQAEKEWWAKRKENWSSSADVEEAKIAKSEELVNTATHEADKNPTAAEQKAIQAEDQAVDAQFKTDNVDKEVKTGQTAKERGAKQPPGAISPATEAWEKSLSPETLKLLEADPELRQFWRDMDPEVRKALTYCASPCIPVQANQWPDVIAQIQTLQNRLKLGGNHRGLREYLYMYRTDRQAMSNAIKALDSINDVKAFEAFLENELIKLISKTHGVTIRKNAAGLWEYPKGNATITEFEIGSHKVLTTEQNATNSFFQSHHGIQNAWAKERFSGLGVYDEDAAKTLLLRTRNMEGGSRGTPHGLINDLQGQRRPTISTRTFKDELAELTKDLDIIGAPPAVKAKYLAEVEGYFRGLYNALSGRLTNDQLKAIFGDWP